MSHSALALGTNRTLATVFYGGTTRGKVIQFNLWPHQLEDWAYALVEDSDYEGVQTLGDWILHNNHNSGMFLFAPGEDPKVETIPVQFQ
jgi:hypothetical protein